jgi:hypothetical protein
MKLITAPYPKAASGAIEPLSSGRFVSGFFAFGKATQSRSGPTIRAMR